MVNCLAYYGTTEWDEESVNKCVDRAYKIFAIAGVNITHYGCSTEPDSSESRVGLIRNLKKKVERIYKKGLKLNSLDLFALSPGSLNAYTDYDIHLARGKDFLVIAIKANTLPEQKMDIVLAEMKEMISPVWEEHFSIQEKQSPYQHCYGEFKRNPKGERNAQGDGSLVPNDDNA